MLYCALSFDFEAYYLTRTSWKYCSTSVPKLLNMNNDRSRRKAYLAFLSLLKERGLMLRSDITGLQTTIVNLIASMLEVLAFLGTNSKINTYKKSNSIRNHLSMPLLWQKIFILMVTHSSQHSQRNSRDIPKPTQYNSPFISSVFTA